MLPSEDAFHGVSGDVAEVKSVTEGDCVTLITNVTKQQHDNMMRWYFTDTLIALINGPNTSCLYDGEDRRFRDRLKVDYQTGSLTITNITTQHTGRYEADIIRDETSGKSESLNRTGKCDSTKITKKSSNRGDIIQSINLTVNGSGLSPAVVAGICVVLLLAAAFGVVVVVGVMIFRRRSSSEDKKKFKHVLEKMSKDMSLFSYRHRMEEV
ncbi:uncharacterized protein LOC127987124 isoform X2 [Carassius gibelio]|uniref:uncharacterized protein LOC127987124 isoform X2 n=1 Tax=Carassius gibelio TaxID=101364 RepID=UPI0022775F89|nr:uncharacterized protein LOC127987124 isoform X2 [Carassius gibelio]